METRTPHWRTLVFPGIFTLCCLLLTLALYGAFGGHLPLAAKGYRVTLPVRDAKNLVPGSDVQIAGVEIGRVVEIKRAGNGASATIELESRFAPVRSGLSAVVRTKTLLGEGYIDISPGPRAAKPIPDGTLLSTRQVDPNVDLDQFVSTFGPTTRQQLRRLFSGLDRALGGRSQDLSDSLGNAAPFTVNLGQVVDILRTQSRDVQDAIAGSGDVFQAVGTREGPLRAAITAGDHVLATTARRHRELTRTVERLAPFLRQLHSTSDAITGAAPALSSAVDALLPSAPLLTPALTKLRTAAPQFRGLFVRLPPVLQAGQRSLPSLARIINSTRGAFKQFYPSARNLIPFMQLLSKTKNVVNLLANLGSVMGTYVGPGGVVQAYPSALATVWNETVAGWTHKLPTNRQNPYPKPPDALLDIGRIGALKSYDCRNTGNPLYLPPTGSGAPPCIVQGPWEFNGKSAAYPRLTLAPK